MTDNVVALKGYFKRGSSWDIALTREDPAGLPVDMTGLTTRAMFRRGDPSGPIVVTLTPGNGINIADPTAGKIQMRVSKLNSAKFADGDMAFFDVEQENPLDPTFAWQSLTYCFDVVEQVTRDD